MSSLPMLDALKEEQLNQPPRPGELVFQRQGVAETLNLTSDGGSFQLCRNRGGGWIVITSRRDGDNTYRVTFPCVRREDALNWIAGRIERATGERPVFSGAVEAYCYADADNIRIWPHLASDWYRTPVFYDAEQAAIVTATEGSRTILSIDGAWPNDGYAIEPDGYAYRDEILEAWGSYQQPVEHRSRSLDESRCYLTWLLGRYMLDAGAPWVWSQTLWRGGDR